jgi:hypothetical protein
MRGLGKAFGVALAALTLLAVGCGGGKDDGSAPGAACDDRAFRGQDEELYVVQATISNAIGGGGDPATLQLDLRRGRAALADYVEAHPPCAEELKAIEEREIAAIAALDDALAALDEGDDPTPSLDEALRLLEASQADLAAKA